MLEYTPADAEEALARTRAACLSLPETSERASHDAPSFFIRGTRNFVVFRDDHHGDGRLGLWCAAAPGAQAGLVGGDPERFYVPAYVGHLGWIGVRLDRGLPWEEVEGFVEEAWLVRAPKRLVHEHRR